MKNTLTNSTKTAPDPIAELVKGHPLMEPAWRAHLEVLGSRPNDQAHPTAAEREDLNREIIVGSRRVEICHEDGMWAAYTGCARNDVNDDDFYGWYESGQAVLDRLSEFLRDKTYWRVAAVVAEMEAGRRQVCTKRQLTV